LLEVRARLARSMVSLVSDQRRELAQSTRRLGDPRRVLAAQQTKIDDLQERARIVLQRQAADARRTLARARDRLLARHPGAVVSQERKAIEHNANKMRAAMLRTFGAARTTVARDSARLDALSPLRVLARGYALVTTSEGQIVKDSSNLETGQELSVRLEAGSFAASVIRKKDAS
jgi:exodeoxyribonuclease VII large subunit